jgi:cytosine/adenosine deaminase-related metal-dependent hydrolase
MVRAPIDAGFRSVLVSEINGDNLDSVKNMEDNFLRFNENHELISALIGFHAEYTSSKELIKAIAKTAERHKAPVYTHNSVEKMINFGIKVALGTDGPVSNNALDMFREMYLTTVLQKVVNNNASAMDAVKVLEMSTKIGASVMGLTDCDTLSSGKLADLIVIDLHQPNMQSLNNILKNLVYSGNKQNVKLTMINGKILYENGKFNIGVKPEEIYKEVNKIKSYVFL